PYDPLVDDCYTGFVNFKPDKDGVSRRASLYAIHEDTNHERTLYPSLAVAALALSQGQTVTDFLPKLPVKVDQDPDEAKNQLFINYAYSDNEQTYPIYSYADVLNG